MREALKVITMCRRCDGEASIEKIPYHFIGTIFESDLIARICKTCGYSEEIPRNDYYNKHKEPQTKESV